MNYRIKRAWIPDYPDKRDNLYLKIKRPIELPEKVDLRPLCSPVETQGDLGSCTAQALVGCVEFLMLQKAKKEMINRFVPGHNYYDLSPLFVYYNERVLERSVNDDAGAQIRSGIKTLAKLGACTEELWPYKIKKFADKPPQPCYEDAKPRLIKNYYRILSLNSMLNCLAEGYPFVFGFTVYSGFEDRKVERTGIVHMPGRKENSVGGHAVCAVGYIQRTKQFIVRNSYGKRWGMSGYMLMPYDYLVHLSEDFWTIRV